MSQTSVPPEAESLQPGEPVDRFVVEALIGEGGMAQVYRVRHRRLGTLHALKVLKFAHAGLRRRLVQEGVVQAGLRHRNIVAVTDVIEDIHGAPGLILELIEGSSLDQRIREGTSLQEAERLFRGTLDGLEHAHQAGFIHRDLKPSNILLAPVDGLWIPKIADFGLAKLLQDDGSVSATRTGMVMGTPAYMSPEQVRDAKTVDTRTDLFALGCILHEMLVGRPPFDGPDLLSVFSALAEGRYVPAEQVIPGLPAHLTTTIHACIQRDRAARTPDCRAVRALLDGGAPAFPAPIPSQLGLTPTRSPPAQSTGTPSLVSQSETGTLAPQPAELSGSLADLVLPDPEPPGPVPKAAAPAKAQKLAPPPPMNRPQPAPATPAAPVAPAARAAPPAPAAPTAPGRPVSGREPASGARISAPLPRPTAAPPRGGRDAAPTGGLSAGAGTLVIAAVGSVLALLMLSLVCAGLWWGSDTEPATGGLSATAPVTGASHPGAAGATAAEPDTSTTGTPSPAATSPPSTSATNGSPTNPTSTAPSTRVAVPASPGGTAATGSTLPSTSSARPEPSATSTAGNTPGSQTADPAVSTASTAGQPASAPKTTPTGDPAAAAAPEARASARAAGATVILMHTDGTRVSLGGTSRSLVTGAWTVQQATFSDGRVVVPVLTLTVTTGDRWLVRCVPQMQSCTSALE